MKRDMDLIRALLIAVDDAPTPELQVLPDLPPADDDEIAYHARLLIQAGFLTAIDISDNAQERYQDLSVTWEGHEFLESVRDPQIWSATKDGAKKLGSWSIGVIADLAKGAIVAKAHALGLPIGG